MINPWKLLNTHRQSSDDEVRQAFHDLAWQHHPDRGGDIRKFQDINAAYQILKDKRRTSIFIKDMILRNKECPVCKGVGATFKQLRLTTRNFKRCERCHGAGVLIEPLKIVKPTMRRSK